MAYTTIDKPSDYFNTKLYTGTGSEQSITMDFAPNWVWLKRRDATGSHRLFDSVRGATKTIVSDATNAEETEAQALTSFNSNGFTLGTEGATNGSSRSFVSWNWKAGGSASSNSNGSITSSVSANQEAGFSIVSYTGTGSNATIGHGLNSAPKMIIFKSRSNADAWSVYNVNIGSANNLTLNNTDGTTSNATMF